MRNDGISNALQSYLTPRTPYTSPPTRGRSAAPRRRRAPGRIEDRRSAGPRPGAPLRWPRSGPSRWPPGSRQEPLTLTSALASALASNRLGRDRSSLRSPAAFPLPFSAALVALAQVPAVEGRDGTVPTDPPVA